MKRFFLLLILLPLLGYSQPQGNKGRLYGFFGLNWAAFTKSDIELKGRGYQFVLTDLKAGNDQNLNNPQYNYRLGYYITDNIAISAGLDHMKYIVRNHQPTKITGRIDSAASPKYAGVFNNNSITLSDQLLHFEHTDGLNFASVELEFTKSYPLSTDNRFSVDMLAGPGIALMIPRTDVTLFGNRINNNYHVSGWGGSVKAGSRINLFRNLFLQGDIKTGYIHLTDVLLTGDTEDRGKHSFGFIEGSIVAGFSVRL